MEMFEAFLVRAILAGVALSLVATPLGCLWFGGGWRISEMPQRMP